MKNLKLSVQVEVAICVALSVVLSHIKLFTMPQGGSVSLQMVPIVLLSMRRGTKVGVLGGVLFGFADMIFGGYVIHPVQGLLDYPIAFSVIALAGMWLKYATDIYGRLRNALALVFGFSFRYLAHVLTGVFFFSNFAGDQHVWAYSLGYNVTYLLPEFIVTLVVALLLMTRRDIIEVNGKSFHMG